MVDNDGKFFKENFRVETSDLNYPGTYEWVLRIYNGEDIYESPPLRELRVKSSIISYVSGIIIEVDEPFCKVRFKCGTIINIYPDYYNSRNIKVVYEGERGGRIEEISLSPKSMDIDYQDCQLIVDSYDGIISKLMVGDGEKGV